MKRFLIETDTIYTGCKSYYKAEAENASDLDALAYEQAVDNFYDLVGDPEEEDAEMGDLVTYEIKEFPESENWDDYEWL
jgi:hypothetical protein